ncbi:hypothetical protein QMK28_33620, partial [Streptomyces sp. H27-D2]|nr:hypothetical protein [Streptomyces sp. H27-D2]
MPTADEQMAELHAALLPRLNPQARKWLAEALLAATEAATEAAQAASQAASQAAAPAGQSSVAPMPAWEVRFATAGRHCGRRWLASAVDSGTPMGAVRTPDGPAGRPAGRGAGAMAAAAQPPSAADLTAWRNGTGYSGSGLRPENPRYAAEPHHIPGADPSTDQPPPAAPPRRTDPLGRADSPERTDLLGRAPQPGHTDQPGSATAAPHSDTAAAATATPDTAAAATAVPTRNPQSPQPAA